jgi:hypothetical protein
MICYIKLSTKTAQIIVAGSRYLSQCLSLFVINSVEPFDIQFTTVQLSSLADGFFEEKN